MAVTYHQSSSFTGTTPKTSGSFTPNAAGDALIALTWEFNNGAVSMLFSGSGTGTWNLINPPGNSSDSNNSTWAAGVNLSSSAAAQTVTVDSSPTGLGNNNNFYLDYSGVVSVKNGSFKTISNPGVGAFSGNAVTVASGDILLVFVGDATGNGAALTSTGSQITANGPLYVFNYSGSGSVITPSITASTHTTDNFAILQFVLSATSGASPSSIAWIK